MNKEIKQFINDYAATKGIERLSTISEVYDMIVDIVSELVLMPVGELVECLPDNIKETKQKPATQPQKPVQQSLFIDPEYEYNDHDRNFGRKQTTSRKSSSYTYKGRISSVYPYYFLLTQIPEHVKKDKIYTCRVLNPGEGRDENFPELYFITSDEIDMEGRDIQDIVRHTYSKIIKESNRYVLARKEHKNWTGHISAIATYKKKH